MIWLYGALVAFWSHRVTENPEWRSQDCWAPTLGTAPLLIDLFIYFSAATLLGITPTPETPCKVSPPLFLTQHRLPLLLSLLRSQPFIQMSPGEGLKSISAPSSSSYPFMCAAIRNQPRCNNSDTIKAALLLQINSSGAVYPSRSSSAEFGVYAAASHVFFCCFFFLEFFYDDLTCCLLVAKERHRERERDRTLWSIRSVTVLKCSTFLFTVKAQFWLSYLSVYFLFFSAVRIAWNIWIWNWQRNRSKVLMLCEQQKQSIVLRLDLFTLHRADRKWQTKPSSAPCGSQSERQSDSHWSRIPGAPGSDAPVKTKPIRSEERHPRRAAEERDGNV